MEKKRYVSTRKLEAFLFVKKFGKFVVISEFVEEIQKEIIEEAIEKYKYRKNRKTSE